MDRSTVIACLVAFVCAPLLAAPVAYEEGLALFRKGDAAGAIRAMTRALDADPKLAKARYVRASALMKEEKYLEAAADYDRLLEDGSPSAKLLTRRALAFLKGDRPREALADALRALELEPGHPTARKIRDRATAVLEAAPGPSDASAKGSPPAADAPAAAAPPVPDPVQDAFEEGQLLYRKDKTKEALAAFTRALKADPTFAPAYHNRAFCHIKLGDRDGAIKDLDALVKIDGQNARAHFDRAETLKALGRLDEACAAFDRCIELEPKNGKALFLRGNCYFNLKAHEKARADWARVVELDPSHMAALNNLAVVLGILERKTEADEVWRKIDALKKKGGKN